MSELYKEKVVDTLFILIQIICIAALIAGENFDYMRMALGNLLFWVIYMILENKQNWRIPLYIRITTLLSITLNDYCGQYLNWYVTSSLYDRLQHIFGTYALTLWIFLVIQQFIQRKLTPKRLTILFMFSLALALGTIYELLEFIEDEVFKPKIKNQPSLLDTNLDLISDLMGGIFAVIHYHISKKLRTFQFPFEQKKKSF
ncbi:hypothetical protein [Neobacillus sp. DY30]|uniref:hypothetical protein n=1 Tax=Neobacillus sp. DY30 TaxID=3047871 RepID=UPI0024C0935B|nr:hypothetical protein [Neobacillus sp. DY30]WHY03208.1 hypothetical protein QNH29_13725 [Neobacillus sp. DY30]